MFSLAEFPNVVESFDGLEKRRVSYYVNAAVALWLRSKNTPTFREFQFNSFKTYQFDLAGVSPDSRLIVVETKSSRSDFRSDKKWRNYLDYADLFYFAVPNTFPLEDIPNESHIGIIVVDGPGLKVLREPELNSPLRKQDFASSLERMAIRKMVNDVDHLICCNGRDLGDRYCDLEAHFGWFRQVAPGVQRFQSTWKTRPWSPIWYNQYYEMAKVETGRIGLLREQTSRIRALIMWHQNKYPPQLNNSFWDE